LQQPCKTGKEETQSLALPNENGSIAGCEIDDQNDQRQHKQEMDRTPSEIQSPPEQPQDYQNRANSPQHVFPHSQGSGPETRNQMLRLRQEVSAMDKA
jgi:hypothetical protein